MVTDICLNPDDSSNTQDDVIIGEGQDSQVVSFQLLQGVYHHLTGKTESIQKSYKKLLKIKFDDISQLHYKLSQSCEQFHVKVSNLSVTVYYFDSTKEQYTSFDRFKLHCIESPHPIESVQLKYEFLIVPPKINKPQQYIVTIRLASKIIVDKVLSQQFFGAIPRIFQQMGEHTAIVKVEYVDYTVARNFLSVIDDWLITVPSSQENKFVGWIQARPYVISRLARLFSVAFCFFVLLYLYPSYISPESIDLFNFGRFFIVTAVLLYVIVLLSIWASGFVESAFENWSKIAFIGITKGDARAIEEAQRKNRRAIARGIFGTIGTMLISIVASVCANMITK